MIHYDKDGKFTYTKPEGYINRNDEYRTNCSNGKIAMKNGFIIAKTDITDLNYIPIGVLRIIITPDFRYTKANLIFNDFNATYYARKEYSTKLSELEEDGYNEEDVNKISILKNIPFDF